MCRWTELLVTLKTVQSRVSAQQQCYKMTASDTNYLHYAQAVHVRGNDSALGLCITVLNQYIHTDRGRVCQTTNIVALFKSKDHPQRSDPKTNEQMNGSDIKELFGQFIVYRLMTSVNGGYRGFCGINRRNVSSSNNEP